MIKFIQNSNPEDLKRLNFSFLPGSNYDDGTLAHVLIRKDFGEAAKALYKKLGIFRATDVFFAFTDNLNHNAVMSAAWHDLPDLLQFFHDMCVPLDQTYIDAEGERKTVAGEAAVLGIVNVFRMLFKLGYDRTFLRTQMVTRGSLLLLVLGHAQEGMINNYNFIRFLASVGADVFSNVNYKEFHDLSKAYFDGEFSDAEEDHKVFLENMVLAEQQPADVRPFYTALLVGNNYLDELKESLRRGNFGDSPRRFFEMAVGPFLQDPIVQKTLNQPVMRPVATFLKKFGNLSWLLDDTQSIEMREYASTDLVEVGRLFFDEANTKAASKWASVVRSLPPDVWFTILSLIYRPLASNLAEWQKMIRSSFPLAIAADSAAPSGPQREFVHIIV